MRYFLLRWPTHSLAPSRCLGQVGFPFLLWLHKAWAWVSENYLRGQLPAMLVFYILETTEKLLLLLLSLFSLILCDPIDGSPPGPAVPGILQARTLERVAMSFSNAWKWKVKVKSLNHVWLFETPWTAAHQAPLSLGFSRQENWSGLPLPSLIGKLDSCKLQILLFRLRIAIARDAAQFLHLQNIIFLGNKLETWVRKHTW